MNQAPVEVGEVLDGKYRVERVLGVGGMGVVVAAMHLKPPNLFLTRGADGRPLIKILDFGIVKAAIDGIDTSTKAVMGSPTYMSPEQWEGARYVDERGDIWALGSILQYLISGRPPFHGESLPVLFRNIATCEPRSLAQAELGIPPGLQEVIRRCLAKSSRDRPQSAAELATLLAPFGAIESQEYAQRAKRVARTGAEAAIQGQGALGTPVYDVDARGEVTLPEESALSGSTSVTTLSSAGTYPGVSTLPSPSATRKWLPYVGIAALLACAVAFGAPAAEEELRDGHAKTSRLAAIVPLDAAKAIDVEKQPPEPETIEVEKGESPTPGPRSGRGAADDRTRSSGTSTAASRNCLRRGSVHAPSPLDLRC